MITAHRFSAVKMNHGDDEVLQCRAHKQDTSGYRLHQWLVNNTLFDIGGLHLKVLHTPGHTSGCICLYESRTRTLISGDTVFANGTISLITRSGSYGDYVNSLGRLKTFKIDRICPGHGELVMNSRAVEETLRQSIDTAEEKLGDMKQGSINEDPALAGI
jgi:glyoxylase-like metal-dependent hydrolase (beta-lactamase superfamily II)